MAELADALDLGSSAARRAGSTPVPGTKKFRARRSLVSPLDTLPTHSDQSRLLSADPLGSAACHREITASAVNPDRRPCRRLPGAALLRRRPSTLPRE